MKKFVDYPSNMSVKNCSRDMCPKPCTLFRTDLEPQKREEGFTFLNANVVYSKLPSDFYAADPCESMSAGKASCSKVAFEAPDPRLIDVTRGRAQKLDRPPIDSGVGELEVYSPKLYKYGQDYKTYSDIKEGQIMYYIDKAIADPLFEPIFSNTAELVGTVYVDPMGGIGPDYIRKPLRCWDKLNSMHSDYDGCLSWIADSNEQREDLISKQMYDINRMKYSARWGANCV